MSLYDVHHPQCMRAKTPKVLAAYCECKELHENINDRREAIGLPRLPMYEMTFGEYFTKARGDR